MSAATTLDLATSVDALASVFPDLEAVWIFGSRRYQTGSLRSDADLLLKFKTPPAHLDVLADVARRTTVYLDAFVFRRGFAESAINGSKILETTPGALVSDIDAVLIWEAGRGFVAPTYRIQRVLRDTIPTYTLAAVLGARAATRAPLDYLLVTALEDEFSAVARALDPYVTQKDPALGMLGRQMAAAIPHAAPGTDESVILCQSDRMGNLASGLTTAEALTRWAPRLTILLGITGGISGKAAIGDLVIADRVFDYETAKVSWRGAASNGVKFTPSFGPRQRLITALDSQRLLEKERPEGGPLESSGESRMPSAIHGGFASGEKVVASRRLTKKIARNDRKLAAIEMESLGVADACRREGREYLIVKAVTDLADARKSDDHRRYCCDLVSRVVIRAMVERVLLA